MEHYSSEWTSLITLTLSIGGGLLTMGWVAAWWVSKKFSDLHDNIDQKVKSLETNIITKLEYHERHDDSRFSAIDKAVWEIRVRNAARDKDV